MQQLTLLSLSRLCLLLELRHLVMLTSLLSRPAHHLLVSIHLWSLIPFFNQIWWVLSSPLLASNRRLLLLLIHLLIQVKDLLQKLFHVVEVVAVDFPYTLAAFKHSRPDAVAAFIDDLLQVHDVISLFEFNILGFFQGLDFVFCHILLIMIIKHLHLSLDLLVLSLVLSMEFLQDDVLVAELFVPLEVPLMKLSLVHLLEVLDEFLLLLQQQIPLLNRCEFLHLLLQVEVTQLVLLLGKVRAHLVEGELFLGGARKRVELYLLEHESDLLLYLLVVEHAHDGLHELVLLQLRVLLHLFIVSLHLLGGVQPLVDSVLVQVIALGQLHLHIHLQAVVLDEFLPQLSRNPLSNFFVDIEFLEVEVVRLVAVLLLLDELDFVVTRPRKLGCQVLRRG